MKRQLCGWRCVRSARRIWARSTIRGDMSQVPRNGRASSRSCRRAGSRRLPAARPRTDRRFWNCMPCAKALPWPQNMRMQASSTAGSQLRRACHERGCHARTRVRSGDEWTNVLAYVGPPSAWLLEALCTDYWHGDGFAAVDASDALVPRRRAALARMGILDRDRQSKRVVVASEAWRISLEAVDRD